MASSINPLFSSAAAASNAASSAASNSSNATGLGATAPTEGVFLQLLVSQLQNQDPLNPTDSTTFVTQLAQFSELEQVIAIRNDTDTLATQNGGAPPTTPPAGAASILAPANTNDPVTNKTTNS
jgi:flagellar basal-body rod modification protein FlgD